MPFNVQSYIFYKGTSTQILHHSLWKITSQWKFQVPPAWGNKRSNLATSAFFLIVFLWSALTLNSPNGQQYLPATGHKRLNRSAIRQTKGCCSGDWKACSRKCKVFRTNNPNHRHSGAGLRILQQSECQERWSHWVGCYSHCSRARKLFRSHGLRLVMSVKHKHNLLLFRPLSHTLISSLPPSCPVLPIKILEFDITHVRACITLQRLQRVTSCVISTVSLTACAR